ncbi:hypothetical protein ACROYT_G026979 [Oculina patagonica]
MAAKCRRINPSVLPACANVGYDLTANFSDVGQKSYQEYVSSEVTYFADRFSNCSTLSKFFVCSRYVPKCSESVDEPVLPCREVCEQFVDDCNTDLKNSGLYKSYVAYCRLLSSGQESTTNCIKPEGFVSRATKDTKLPNCETASQPACLEDNYSGLGNTTRTRLQDALNSLAPVLNTSCSVNLKKFACFIETAPCVTNDGSTLHACQSLCKEVRLKCGEELKRHGISFPQCIHNYPEIDAGNGLCQLSHWPVPWPAKLKQNPDTTPRSPKVISKPKRGEDKQTNTPDPDGNKETKKKGLAGGVLAAAVVGFLIVFSVISLLLHLTVKKLKENAKARRRGSAKQYVNDSNISSNGKAVTIGTRNKSFEDEITQSESALY